MSTANQLIQAANQVVESVHNLPDEVKGNPIEAIGILAVGYGIWFKGNKTYDKRANEVYAADHPDMPEVMSAIEDIKSIKREDDEAGIVADSKGNRRARLKPVAAVLSGLAILGGTAELNPVYTTSSPAPGEHVMVVEGVTQSMWYTKDLGRLGKVVLTRDQLVDRGIGDARRTYRGSLGVVEAAGEDSNKQVIPPSTSWRSQLSELNTPQVSQTADYEPLVPAIQMGESGLPLVRQPNGEFKHDGTEVIVTDGIIDDEPQDIQNEANQLEADGVKVDVIIVGTETPAAVYTPVKDGPSYSSTVEPQTMSGFAQSAKFTQAETAQSAVEATQNDISAAGDAQNNHPWLPPYIAGGILLAVGLIKDIKQRFKLTV